MTCLPSTRTRTLSTSYVWQLIAIQTPTHIAQCDSRTSTARSPEALFYHLINGVTIAWAELTSYLLLRSVGKNRGHVGSVLNCHSRVKRSFYFQVLYFFSLFLSDYNLKQLYRFPYIYFQCLFIIDCMFHVRGIE